MTGILDQVHLLPDVGAGIESQFAELSRAPTPERCIALARNLEGALYTVQRLREGLVAEGEGHGQ